MVPTTPLEDIRVYQPLANLTDFGHPLTEGLRPNARQLVEAAILGYDIGNDASPMTVVDTGAWEEAGGHVSRPPRRPAPVRTRRSTRQLDDGSLTSIGELGSAPAGADRRRRAADADRVAGPPLRPAQLRPDLLGPVPDGERDRLQRRRARRLRPQAPAWPAVRRSAGATWPSSARPQPPAPAVPAPGAGAPGHHQPQALPLLRPRYEAQGHGGLRPPREGGADHHERDRSRQPRGPPGPQRAPAAPRLPEPQENRPAGLYRLGKRDHHPGGGSARARFGSWRSPASECC